MRVYSGLSNSGQNHSTNISNYGYTPCLAQISHPVSEIFTDVYKVVKVTYWRNACDDEELGGSLSVHNRENEYVRCTKFKLWNTMYIAVKSRTSDVHMAGSEKQSTE